MTSTRAEDFQRLQESRSQASRQQILDSAVQCLVEDGYSGASTLRIQELAGVSRGRLLHHFPSRDELLVGAVAHLVSNRVATLQEEALTTITAADGDPLRIDQAVDQMWVSFHQPYFWASIELWIAARHNENLRRALKPAERKLYKAIRATLDSYFGPTLCAHPRYRQTVDMLVSSMRGVALTYAFDARRPARDLHVAQWREVARVLLS
ncbi:TetR/AcrR family transcriptional regulator [Antrihabitans stalactiti]|uniref:TetR/AcrR family transcriptional regulator n=1 Tax=Antrihabitans stalactiti TaxID=2584121 RepID=A0A848KD89_9NOCA|nr:TetR/AcrR family transcriptional regulator [Antrihabitans stalactiti]NMN93997.1 TetR/AcrR family transcriptional regulator [Antrihabitans stalactiti]